MLDVMYEIPSLDDVRECVVDETVITEGKPPRIEPVRDFGVPG